jgi:hypothetical protein
MYYGAAKRSGLRSRRSMTRIFRSLDRVLPSLLMAAGVMLLTAGLLALATPGSHGQAAATAVDDVAGGDPLFSGASASPIDLRPSTSPLPLPSPGSSGERGFASRIRLPSLGIDLPVIAGDAVVPGNENSYPLCDVAMYLPDFVQPGEPGTTYIYAHAQRGMFLPLLHASQVDAGASLVGALVEVYTTTDELHVYDITRVKQHATDLSIATDVHGAQQLVLQTSEGPSGTVPKLQIAARPISTVQVDATDAQPAASPRVCLPPSPEP